MTFLYQKNNIIPVDPVKSIYVIPFCLVKTSKNALVTVVYLTVIQNAT